MAQELNESPKSFKVDGKPPSPYDKGKAEWDHRQGDIIVQKYNWQKIAFGLMLWGILATGGLIFQSTKATVTPYVVEVGRDGTAAAIGPAAAQKYEPKEEEIKYFLSQLVLKARSVPADAVLYKRNWLSVYSFLEDGAKNKINNLMSKDPQTSILEKRGTVEVNISSILPTTKDSYQLRWKEDVFDQSGQVTSSYTMTGTFTLDFLKPKTEKELLNNPLGLYIKDVSWTRDF